MSLQVVALYPRRGRGGVLASMLAFATLCVTLRASAAPPPDASMSGESASAAVSKVRTDVVVMAQNVAEGAMALQETTPRRARSPETSPAGERATTSDGATTASERTRRSATTAPANESAKRAGASAGRARKTGASSKTEPSPARAPRGRQRVSFEDDFLVEGRLEKPSAYYILRRSDADYDWARMDAKFLPLVLESVQDPLF